MAPLGVLVSTEFRIMTDSPRADILIIKKKAGRWTPDQLRLIPDGIRDTKSRYIILEFKYSQSLSDKTFQQPPGVKTSGYFLSSLSGLEMFFNILCQSTIFFILIILKHLNSYVLLLIQINSKTLVIYKVKILNE